MGDIVVAIDTDQVEEALRTLGTARAKAALRRAVNTTATQVRRGILKTLKKETGLAQKTFNAAVTVKPGRARQAPDRPKSDIEVDAVVVTLGWDISAFRREFKPDPNVPFPPKTPLSARPAGVTTNTGKAGRQLVKSSFIARMPNGKLHVMVRSFTSKDARFDRVRIRRRRRGPVRLPSGKKTNDLPIAKVVVPGPSTIMLRTALQQETERQALKNLTKNVKEAVIVELLKATGVIPGKKKGKRAS